MIIGIDIGGTHFRVDAAKRVRTDKKIHPTAAGLLMFGEEFCVYPKLVKDLTSFDNFRYKISALKACYGFMNGNLAIGRHFCENNSENITEMLL